MTKRPSEYRKETAGWRASDRRTRMDDPEVIESSRTDEPPNRPKAPGQAKKHRIAGYDADDTAEDLTDGT